MIKFKRAEIANNESKITIIYKIAEDLNQKINLQFLVTPMRKNELLCMR